MRNMRDTIYKLIAHPDSGVTVTEIAEACYLLAKQLGIPVEFVHNDTHYTVSLEVHKKES